jgi:hypothetical protein
MAYETWKRELEKIFQITLHSSSIQKMKQQIDFDWEAIADFLESLPRLGCMECELEGECLDRGLICLEEIRKLGGENSRLR